MKGEKKRTTTTVFEEFDEYKKEHQLEWNEIIGLGILAHKKNPQLIQRINIIEQRINTIIKKLNRKI